MRISLQWRHISQRLLSLPCLLMMITLIYVGVYLALPYTPGSSPTLNSLSWWGWFDQSQYLKAANALYALNFSADQYFYPPLYPALGSLFLVITDYHPFFLVNLLCLLWFVYVFILFCDRYVPRAVGVFVLFASMIFPILIFENFVIPWTTSFSTALLATGILGLMWVDEIKKAKRKSLQNWQALIVALSLGLMVPTRPVDAIVGILIGCAFVLSYLRLPRETSQHTIPPVQFLGIALIGSLVGPIIFIGFNLLVHGAPLGNYLQVAGSHGFSIADLPEKFYSIWLNAQPLYGEVGAGLVQHYPWLLLSLAGLVWAIVRGDFLLRTLAAAIITFFILYLPYGDLLPNGLWRFLNIHYFKWTFPFLALFACILIGQTLQSAQVHAGWKLPCSILIVVPLLLLMLQMRVITGPLLVAHEQSRVLNMDLPERSIDFIDIKGLSSDFTSTYFGEHSLIIDGQALKLYRNFRLLDHGADTRLLFIRPVIGRKLEFLPDPRLQLYDGQLNAQWGAYSFALGLPKPDVLLKYQKVPAAYRLGQVIDFSNQGISHFYIGEGFSIPENQGRWSNDDRALISLRIIDFSPDKRTQVALIYKTLIADRKQCQQVIIKLNQQKIGSNRLCLQNKGDTSQTYYYDIASGVIGNEGVVQIEIETPDSVSPLQLEINTDDRKLGVYVQKLVMTQ